MAAIDFDSLSLVEAVSLLQSRVVTSEALVRESIRRVHAFPELCAVSALDTDRALAAARRTDALLASLPTSSPLPLPLLGVPVLLKDNLHVQGLPNASGTPALLSFHPATDAPLVHRLRTAGAIVLGKAHMHELSYGVTGYTALAQHQGRIGVRNAYDTAYVAGGSSSGCGAALGARIVYAALGSDTAGSVRIPAALNGVCGLRPSTGRYSTEGMTPMAHSRDTPGPMAITMADVELLDRVLTDSAPVVPPPLASIRLGVLNDFLRGVDAATETAFRAALKRLQAAGVTLVDVDEPGFQRLHSAIGPLVTAYENFDTLTSYLALYLPSLTLDAVIAEAACPDLRALYKRVVLPRLTAGPDGSLVDAAPLYAAAASEGRPALRRLYAETMEAQGLDGLVFPTVPRRGVRAEEGCSGRATALEMIRHVGPGSLVGLPGVCLPVGLGEDELPVSMAVDGREGGDRQLIAVAMALEQCLGRLAAPAWLATRPAVREDADTDLRG